MTTTEVRNLSKKEEFLYDLQTKGGKNKYRRYTKSPLRYAGGKSLAVGMITELIPEDTKKVVSPFMGGGSVEIAIAKELDIRVDAYDIFDFLTAYWNEQLQNPERLAKNLETLKPTQKTFYDVKEILKTQWPEGRTMSDEEIAYLYYFNSNTSYGPHFLGWPSNVYLDKKRYEKTVQKVRDFSAPKLKVKCASFEKVIPKAKGNLLYCDPPYFLGGTSKMFIGMYPHRNFPVHHDGFDHKKLRDLLMSHEGGFILSYNDCEEIREWYKGCNMSFPTWQYTFGQGDTRIGKNRSESESGNHIKQSHEILIWKLPNDR